MILRLHIPRIEEFDRAVLHFYGDSPYGYEYVERKNKEIAFCAFSESHAEKLKKCLTTELEPLGITCTFN